MKNTIHGVSRTAPFLLGNFRPTSAVQSSDIAILRCVIRLHSFVIVQNLQKRHYYGFIYTPNMWSMYMQLRTSHCVRYRQFDVSTTRWSDHLKCRLVQQIEENSLTLWRTTLSVPIRRLKSFLFRWLHAHALFDVTCLHASVGASDVKSRVLSIRLLLKHMMDHKFERKRSIACDKYVSHR